VNFGEWIEEVGACSAPIFTPAGGVVGAIGVAGPIARLNVSNVDRVGDVVKEHAQRFSSLVLS
jgi:DNA-binding IclR family transcriptional regulator